MAQVIAATLCFAGAATMLWPWIYAYGREWLAVRKGIDRSLEHRDLDAFDWSLLIGRGLWYGLPLIAMGIAVWAKH